MCDFLAPPGIGPNDTLTAETHDGKIVLSKRFQHRTLKQRAADYGGQLNLYKEIPWCEPVGDVVRNNVFNLSCNAIVYTIMKDVIPGPLHIKLTNARVEGFVACVLLR